LNKSQFQDIKNILKETIEEYSKIEEKSTNPGFVISRYKPDKKLYKKAVTQLVKLDEITEILNKLDADYKGYKNSRGLIGATSSIAWDSNFDKTFEIISYRKENAWGSSRYIDANSVIDMDNGTIKTFDNYDYVNKHNRIMPNSPCPILFGIRGEDSKELINALKYIKSEPINSWIIFETNQGTDDHLQKKKILDVKPFESVIVKGKVSTKPTTIRGGHVFFKLKNKTGSIDCAAYEPTKDFRNIIRELTIGDIVEVYGGVRQNPLTINIERIRIYETEDVMEKFENPVCPKCGKHMKSKGKNQIYKCKNCGIKSDKPSMKVKKRSLKLDFYEVPVCARRHLSKPLKRMNK